MRRTIARATEARLTTITPSRNPTASTSSPSRTKNALLLVSQYRPAVGRVVFDFPAGLIEDADAEPLDCARRELLEETGYTSETWLATGRVKPAPHRLRKTEHCFVALDVKQIRPPIRSEHEQVALISVNMDELDRMIDDGEFVCGVCLSSLTLAERSAPHVFSQARGRHAG